MSTTPCARRNALCRQTTACCQDRIDALPASFWVKWSFITLLTGGFLSSTIPSRLGISARACWRMGIFHTGQAGIFGIADQSGLPPPPPCGDCLSRQFTAAPLADNRPPTDLAVALAPALVFFAADGDGE